MQRFLIFTLMLLAATAAEAADAPDLLAPQVAFRLSAKMETGDELLVRFDIAPGYYLYRNKLQFSVEPAGVTLGTPRKPKGRPQEDEFFGRVEIYRADVVIHIPVGTPARSAQLHPAREVAGLRGRRRLLHAPAAEGRGRPGHGRAFSGWRAGRRAFPARFARRRHRPANAEPRGTSPE